MKFFDTEERLEALARNTPLKRVGTAEEIAAAAVFLCGDEAPEKSSKLMEVSG